MEYTENCTTTVLDATYYALEFFVNAIADIKTQIIKSVDIKMMYVFLQTCKSWKRLVKKGFNYSCRDQLPITFSYINKNYKEVARLSNCSYVKLTSPDLIRAAIIYEDIPMLKLILQTPNMNLNAPISNKFHYNIITRKITYPSKRYENYHHSSSRQITDTSILPLCVVIQNLTILEMILQYDSKILCNSDLTIAIERGTSDTFLMIMKYIGRDRDANTWKLIHAGINYLPLGNTYKMFMITYLTTQN
jgi:hypothetical protein